MGFGEAFFFFLPRDYMNRTLDSEIAVDFLFFR